MHTLQTGDAARRAVLVVRGGKGGCCRRCCCCKLLETTVSLFANLVGVTVASGFTEEWANVVQM